MQKDARIFVAGHRGLVGGALLRRLEAGGYSRLLTRTRQQLDLTDAGAVASWFAAERPEFVFLAAAKVGGIAANSRQPVEFLRENLAIQSNILHAAWQCAVRKLLFLGSSCIYPKFADQPIREEALLTGALEPTNEAYAIAKIAGLKLCAAYNRQYGTNFLGVMPCNLYGPGDHFDLENSHVLPALIRRLHEAQAGGLDAVEIWGTGTPRREFLHCDDLADACVHLMAKHDAADLGEFVNVGAGQDLTIRELAEMVADVVGFTGRLAFNPERPDGTPRKLLDVSRLAALGWQARIDLRTGIEQTYRWYVEQVGGA